MSTHNIPFPNMKKKIILNYPKSAGSKIHVLEDIPQDTFQIFVFGNNCKENFHQKSFPTFIYKGYSMFSVVHPHLSSQT